MNGSLPSLVSPNVHQVHTNVTQQVGVPIKIKFPSAEPNVNCKMISVDNKDRMCRETFNNTDQTVEINSNMPPLDGLRDMPTNRVDSNTIMIGEPMEGCVVVDLQGNVMVKEDPSVQAQSTPYLINERVLVQVSSAEQTVQVHPSPSKGRVTADIQPSHSINSLNNLNKEVSDVSIAQSNSEEHSNSFNSGHLKFGVTLESRLVFHEVSGNDYPTICLPQGLQKENLEVKIKEEEMGAYQQLPKRKSARKARLKWKCLEEDNNFIRKINILKKRKHYPLSLNDKGKISNYIPEEPPMTDLPVWARYLSSVRLFDSNCIFGIASSKAILYQTMEAHSRSILCDYIRSHPSNFVKRRSNKSQECRVMWQYKMIIFDGVPFTMVSSDDHKCTFGMKYKIKRKDNDKVPKATMEDEPANDSNDDDTKAPKNDNDKDNTEKTINNNNEEASKTNATPKKMYKDVSFTSCPAKITVKVIIKYPGYAVSPLAFPKERKLRLKALRADLSRKVEVEKEELYYVTLPVESMHNHPCTGRSRNIHPSIIAKVKGLIREGITTPKIIKRLLDAHVQMEYGKDMVTPHPDDRAYYPKVKDIANLVYNYCKKMGIPSKRKNVIEQAIEAANNKKKKRHRRSQSEGGSEGECCNNEITGDLTLQASTLQEAVRTFCTDESDRANIVGVEEQECVPSSNVTQFPSRDVSSLAEVVRGQLDSLRNITYSLSEVGHMQDMYQSLQVLLNQYTTVNHQSLQGAISGNNPTAAFIIHESVVDPVAGTEHPMQVTSVSEADHTSLSVPEREDANGGGVAVSNRFRNTQLIENPSHIRQFRPPMALQCLTTNVVPALAVSQLPRSSNQTSDQGSTAQIVTSLPSHSAANPATVSITQPTFQSLAPTAHDASAVPVQLSLPPYIYYVQEVTVPETTSTNSSVNG